MVRDQMALIQDVQTDEWWEDVTVAMLEVARRRLRELVQLIEKQKRRPIYTDFEDVLGAEAGVALPGFAEGEERHHHNRGRQPVRLAFGIPHKINFEF